MMPFTIDHHGTMGPIALELIFGQENATFTNSTNEYDNGSTSTEVKDLINLSMHKNRHKNILTQANNMLKQAYGSK